MPGRLVCVTATLCYGIGSILTRRAPAMPPLALAGGMLLVATAILAPLALIFEGLPDVAVSRATLALVFVGLLPTGIAFYLRIRIIQSAGMIFMSLVAYIVPVWAVIFGISLMGDPEQQYFVDGMHDALITELSKMRIPTISVVFGSSTAGGACYPS